MIFTRQDHDRLDSILIEAARREVMPRFRKLAQGMSAQSPRQAIS